MLAATLGGVPLDRRDRPQTALFVNETTLLPLFVALAPAAGLLDRFTDQLDATLSALTAPPSFVETELGAMGKARWAKTANRSVVGSMTDFAFLADHQRRLDGHPKDLVTLSVRLAHTPCSPLYKRHISPDQELAALIDPTP